METKIIDGNVELFKHQLEEKYISKMEETINKYSNDNEALHAIFDDILLNVLEELGCEKIVEKYNATEEEITFWRA